MLSLVMLNVTNKPFMLSVIMLSVIMLSVVKLSAGVLCKRIITTCFMC